MAYHLNGGGYSGDERESRSGGDDRPDNDLADKPIYLLEHLATFTVNKETGIVYPADGMRRLLQLEKTTGIWSQKMQLCLDYQWVLIMDYETGNVIERFPASLIQEPTAFTSSDPMEMYNNILVFIVTGGSGSRSEMHIFQSQGVSAIHLVEDLKQLRNGKLVTQHRETIPAILPQMKTSFNQHRGTTGIIRGGAVVGLNESSGEHSFGMSREISSVSGAGSGVVGGVGGGHETDSEIGCANDETSSTSSDKYERDVTVLNHCFDDIEKFIARLQHAAAASRELERRRRNRKSKKKDPGEGLLTLRTRPPHEKEFIDIFAKFKLSFNLLAKLKAHIHDPNAPELVHFLFTPLALIVEASSDTYFESQLPQRVINPLLTREAINLLINCVTSKETELWRSLGEAWTVPRDQWKEDVGSYHPVFLDGWSPDYLVIDELDHLATPTNIKRRIEPNHNFVNSGGVNGSSVGVDYDYDSPQGVGLVNEKYTHHHTNQSSNVSGIDRDRDLKDFSARSDISLDSIERNGGPTSTSIGPLNNSLSTLGNGGHSSHLSTAQNAGLQTITGGMQNLYSRSGSNGGSNSAGSLSGVGNDNVGVSGNTRAGVNNVGIGAQSDDHMIEAWLDELQVSGAKIVLVTHPKTANNDKELSVVRGEYLEILDDSRQWWKARNSRGQIAHVPHTLVIPYNYNENEFNNQYYTHHYKSNARQSTDSNSQVGGTSQQQNSADWVRNKHIVRRQNIFTLLYCRSPNLFALNAVLLFVGSEDVYESPIHYAVPKNHERLSLRPQRALYSPANQFSNIRTTQQYSPNVLRMTPLQPPPPPPPPPLPISGASNNNSKNSYILRQTLTKNTNTGSVRSISQPIDGVYTSLNQTNDVMQEELKQVLRSRVHRDLDILKTPQIYIDQMSSPVEVERWLKAKEFSDAIIKRLHGFNGEDMFELPPEKMENYFGSKESKRLASQVMLQKSVSGYKTATTTELQAVLARAKPKTELHTNDK